ncbi:Abi family protein [Enterococcus thailandicus]|uniref:Abi family protein n=1 Tax=Enterococcus thailandicus TaxID=417368 RepID=UPI0022E5B35F|nr:Abi family protein [Enterococcus thailandicus]MDT2793493.1 Abi family protein [Enterococcus thailandicus]MEA4830497.1 Abi family protein [Enterococcus thailandicus]
MAIDSRPFKEIDDQIDGLACRGLTIENRSHTFDVLLRNNYYCVINGYKRPFLKKDMSGNFLFPETYNDGTRFSEVYSLYKMDKELRILFLRHILQFENKMKAIISYEFSKAHPEKYGYLHFSNYSSNLTDLSDVLKSIQKLSNKIEIHKQKKYDNAIKHYINKHKNVPLWVLSNFLTFGELQYLFLSLEDSVKLRVARVISEDFKKMTNSKEKIDVEEIKMIMKTANLFRNVCAHDEVLYNYKISKKLKSSLFRKYFVANSAFGVDSSTSNCNANLFVMLSLLKIVTPNKDFKDMTKKLNGIFKKSGSHFTSISFESIMIEMGFEPNWQDQLKIKAPSES